MKFYTEVCGATVLNRGYWLWLGNVQLHLIQGENAREEATHASGIATGNVNHISFEVYDFDGVESRLNEMKVAFKKNRVPEGGHVIHQLFLTDPDGHYVEICDCNRFSDFIFGPKPSKKSAMDVASGYLEGVDPTNATVAAVAALQFLGTDKEGEISNLQRAFKLFSKGDDKLDAADLDSMMRRMGYSFSPAEVADMLEQADSDKSGYIGFKEFVRMMAPHLHGQRSAAQLRECFEAIDRDNDGRVSSDDLLLMQWGIGQRVNEEELQQAIERADKNCDGMVDLEEFMMMFEPSQDRDQKVLV
jgi:Ca2+-binding EF-hand superfamily protein